MQLLNGQRCSQVTRCSRLPLQLPVPQSLVTIRCTAPAALLHVHSAKANVQSRATMQAKCLLHVRVRVHMCAHACTIRRAAAGPEGRAVPRQDVSVVTANPKTAGVARWNFLALWGHKAKQGDAACLDFVTKVAPSPPVDLACE